MKFKSRLEEIDPRYYTPCEQKGSLERIEYKATNYDGRVMDKYAYVYLPCGYDPEKEYDILYLIHGGGESAEKYLYLGGEENQLKNAVDHLIAEKTIKPLIICTPSPYPDNKVVTSSGDNASFVRHFHNELCDELMPIVESRYHTFAKSSDAQGLKEARRHRAVMGWSMGSFTTWCVFLSRIGWFDRFGFLSCYYGLIEDPLTKEWADEHASEIVEKVRSAVRHIKRPLTVAVMGCVVNGPGEAKEADIGVAGGRDGGVLFVKNMPPRPVKGDIAAALIDAINEYTGDTHE